MAAKPSPNFEQGKKHQDRGLVTCEKTDFLAIKIKIELSLAEPVDL
jgi:hypothetical protein